MQNFKLLLLALTLCTFLTPQNANAQKYKLDKWEARAGIGLLPTFIKDHAKSELQPISFELRYRMNKKMSLGLLVGNSVSQAYQKHHSGATRMVRNHFKMAAIRAAVHSSSFEKLEMYGGILLGYTKNNVDYTDTTKKETIEEPSFFPVQKTRDGILFSAFIGSSYKVRDNVRLFGELSYGLSILTTGISISF